MRTTSRHRAWNQSFGQYFNASSRQGTKGGAIWVAGRCDQAWNQNRSARANTTVAQQAWNQTGVLRGPTAGGVRQDRESLGLSIQLSAC